MTMVKDRVRGLIGMLDERNRPLTLNLCLLLLFVGLLVLISASRMAQAWDEVKLNAIEAPGMYVTAGYYYYTGYWMQEYNSSQFSSLNVYYQSTNNVARGFLVFPIWQLDERTYVADATLKFLAYNNEDTNLRLRILEDDPRNLDAETTYKKIGAGVDAGTISFNNYLSVTTYFFVFSGSALTSLRDQIAAGGQYLFIGFEATYGAANVICRFSNILGTFHTYLQLTVDASPPEVPVPKALDAYSPGTTLMVKWPAAWDLPGGTTRGGVEYQVGNFYSNSSSETPYHTTSWNSSLSQTLPYLMDGGTYFFRVRARDASGFESAWSRTISTTMDNSPPSMPILLSEPQYSVDSTNLVEWWASTDAGIGNITYELRWSDSPGFDGPSTFMTKDTNHTVPSLVSGTTYYYSVRAKDQFDHWSGWGPAVFSTQDAKPPTAPAMLEEPPYTEGTTNAFSWQPSLDDGVGVRQYHVRVSTDPFLGPARVVLELNTTLLSVEADGLQDGETYYAQAMAMDAFGHWSVWSNPVNSTQDAGPPAAPVMLEEPLYTQGTINMFWWQASTDWGVGVAQYRVRVSIDPAFAPARVVLELNISHPPVAVGDLQDGETYYAQAMAMDAFGHWSTWSDPVSSIQDGVGPSKPGLSALPAFSSDSSIHVLWNGSVDAGAGLGWYDLYWSQDGDFAEGVSSRTHLLGSSESVPAAAEGRWYFKLVPFDVFGQEGESETVSTIVDTTPPTAPALEELPPLTHGKGITLRWSISMDALSGFDYYVVTAYSSEEYSAALKVLRTKVPQMTLGPFLDGGHYWFSVTAYDVVGNWNESGIWGTAFDDSPPPVPVFDAIPSYIAETNLPLTWTCEPDRSGMPVEYRVYMYLEDETEYLMRYDWTLEKSLDVTGLQDGRTYRFRVMSKDSVGWMSDLSTPVTIMVDLSPPVANITSPVDGARIGDLVPVMGSITDASYIESYCIQIALRGSTDWQDILTILPSNARSVDGVIATWSAEGMAEGSIRIRLTATDALGLSASSELGIIHVGANLSIGPSDIVFSNPHPLPGEKVTAYVTVHNYGSSDAQGVTIVVMADGVEVANRTGVTVPARGSFVIPVQLKAPSKGMMVTVRATADLHDSGEMAQGAELVSIEKEAALEDTGGMLGLVALLVAVGALVVALVLGRRKGH